MTYYGAKELAAAFRTVRENTIKIAEDIPAESYSYRPTPDSRSVAELLIHMAVSTRMPETLHFQQKLTSLEGFNFFALMGELRAEEQKPYSKDEILEMLRTTLESYSELLAGCSDEFLGETVTFPEGMTPPHKVRFEMLLGSKEHEMHHRGQLMVVERLLGITPHLTRRMEEFIAARMAASQGAKA